MNERVMQLSAIAAKLTAELSKVTTELQAELTGVPITNRVQHFIDTQMHRVNGSEVRFKEFFESFRASLLAEERSAWTRSRVEQDLAPLKVVNTGRADQPTRVIEGLSWTAPKTSSSTPIGPAFDKDVMGELAYKLKKEGLDHGDIALRLNDMGHADEYGLKWSAFTVMNLLG